MPPEHGGTARRSRYGHVRVCRIRSRPSLIWVTIVIAAAATGLVAFAASPLPFKKIKG